MKKSRNHRKVKIVGMVEYIQEAAKLARYEWCDDVKEWAAIVSELPICWSQGRTIEETRLTLLEVIEEWIILGLQFGDEIPVINGMRIGYDHKLCRKVRTPREATLTEHRSRASSKVKVAA